MDARRASLECGGVLPILQCAGLPARTGRTNTVPLILPPARLTCRSAPALRSLMPLPGFLRLSGWSGWASASWAESMGNMLGKGMTGSRRRRRPRRSGPVRNQARHVLAGFSFCTPRRTRQAAPRAPRRHSVTISRFHFRNRLSPVSGVPIRRRTPFKDIAAH